MLPPFEAPKLKLRRAARHLDELGQDIGAFLGRKPFALVIEQPDWWTASWPIHAWTIRIREAVPHDLSAIIGDAIHNLRAALDLLACDLVRLNGKSDKGVQFPFSADAADLPHQIKSKNLNRAAPDVVRLLTSLKPYRGGNLALRAVHDLDIQDKHQALIPVANFVEAPGGTMMIGGRANLIPNWESKVTHDGQVLVMMPVMGNLSLGDEIAAKFALIFGENDVLAGREVVEALHSLMELVAGIVKSFETLCAGRPNRYVAPGAEPPKGHRALLIGSTKPAPP